MMTMPFYSVSSINPIRICNHPKGKFTAFSYKHAGQHDYISIFNRVCLTVSITILPYDPPFDYSSFDLDLCGVYRYYKVMITD